MCKNNPNKRCRDEDNFDECYADCQVLRSKCEADIFLELVDPMTGQAQSVPGIELQASRTTKQPAAASNHAACIAIPIRQLTRGCAAACVLHECRCRWWTGNLGAKQRPQCSPTLESCSSLTRCVKTNILAKNTLGGCACQGCGALCSCGNLEASFAPDWKTGLCMACTTHLHTSCSTINRCCAMLACLHAVYAGPATAVQPDAGHAFRQPGPPLLEAAGVALITPRSQHQHTHACIQPTHTFMPPCIHPWTPAYSMPNTSTVPTCLF